MAIGNQERQDLGPGPVVAFQFFLLGCRVVSSCLTLLTRNPFTKGFRYDGVMSLLAALLPSMLVASLPRGVRLTDAEVTAYAACSVATPVLLGLYVIHVAASRRTRGREHSKFMGCTWLCNGPREWLELPLGLALAHGLSAISPPLAGLMVAASIATIIDVAGCRSRQVVSVDRAFDAQVEGRAFADAMQQYRRRSGL